MTNMISVETIVAPEFRVGGIPGFENVQFIGGDTYLDWYPSSVPCKEGLVLQSALEAAAYRMARDGNYMHNPLPTRTAVVYFQEGGKFYAAIDDTPDEEKNIILARWKEGRDAHEKLDDEWKSSGKHVVLQWKLPKSDAHIQEVLSRAERDDRIVDINEPRNFGSVGAFSYDRLVQAVLGSLTRPFAESYKSSPADEVVFRGSFSVNYLTRFDLREFSLGDSVEVRNVYLRNSGRGLNLANSFLDVDFKGWKEDKFRLVRNPQEFTEYEASLQKKLE